VDPLDGTANFLHGHPGHAVSIGVAIDGVPIAGHDRSHPGAAALRRLAGRWGMGGEQRLRVSPISEPAHALIGTGFPFKNPELLPPTCRSWPGSWRRRAACVAAARPRSTSSMWRSGRFDAFWEMMLAPWDMAAGMVLVREAGGVVWNFEGRDAPVDHGPVLAGNGAMAEWLLSKS
jgi:myo-inositol-1(or 4)-monophosphatase